MNLKTVLACTLLVAAVKSCPLTCICTWREAKQIVECPSKNLQKIPLTIDYATQILDLSGNNIENFIFKHFINLQKLFLENCQINSLKGEAFEGLTNLIELDLSKNFLEKVPSEALIQCPLIMKVNLSKNPIKSLEKQTFNKLNFLQNLDLSSCEINQINPEAFSGLYSLEWLDLSQNKLKNLRQMSMPQSIKGVQLHLNPFRCDCLLKPLKLWLHIYPVLVAPTCEEPQKLRGLPIRGLNDSELSCEPQIEYFEIEEGKNVTLICENETENTYWQFKNQNISLNNFELFISDLKNDDNGTYFCLAQSLQVIVIKEITLKVISKHKNAGKLRQGAEKSSILPVLLPVGLILGSICFVALIMTLIKRQRKTENIKPGVIGAGQRDGKSDFFAMKIQPQIRRQRTQPYFNPTLRSNFRPVSAPTFERYIENFNLN